MPIKILDRDTIEKITAGEVIERPVSAAKELIENSLDAGATGITVEIRDGGLSYLRVTDNGCGIPENETKIAFQSHATSKLRDAEGLNNLCTLGFRGEALPSIASVTKVVMTTKTADAPAGTRIRVEGGYIQEITQAGCPNGTTIVVTDFFYNVPVRRTFLKKPAYEQSLISELVQKLALGNPKVAFKLISSGKVILQTNGDGNMRHAALSVYGMEYAANLVEADESEGAFAVKGFIGVGEQSAMNRSRQCFFLNGRLINCRMLSQALEEVCRGRVMIGRYPTCALSVSMPSNAVDINVHPSKLEVRFRDEAAFRLTAQTLLRRAFGNQESMFEAGLRVPETQTPQKTVQRVDVLPPVTPQVKPVAQQVKKEETSESVKTSRFDLGLAPDALRMPKVPEAVIREPVSPIFEAAKPVRPEKTPEPEIRPEQLEIKHPELEKMHVEYRLIGVYLNTYILLEVNESLVLIDQHAAHERLNYENYTKRLSEGVASQQLLVPIVINVSARELAVLEGAKELIHEAGYEIEPFGTNALKVTAVPFIYGESDLKLLFADMIDSLEMLKHAEKERRLTAVIQASCKHAIKGGDRLTHLEIVALLESLETTKAAPTCPHGRPVMKVFTKNNIETLFKRIQ